MSGDASNDSLLDAQQPIQTPLSPNLLPLAAIPTCHVHAEPEHYLIGTAIFGTLLVAAVAAQISAKRFRPFLYWAVIVTTTTVGTKLADFLDRSLGIGYLGGSLILFALVLASLGIWYRTCGSVSVDTVASPRVELFYWATILFSQTLGTAIGD